MAKGWAWAAASARSEKASASVSLAGLRFKPCNQAFQRIHPRRQSLRIARSGLQVAHCALKGCKIKTERGQGVRGHTGRLGRRPVIRLSERLLQGRLRGLGGGERRLRVVSGGVELAFKALQTRIDLIAETRAALGAGLERFKLAAQARHVPDQLLKRFCAQRGAGGLFLDGFQSVLKRSELVR